MEAEEIVTDALEQGIKMPKQNEQNLQTCIIFSSLSSLLQNQGRKRRGVPVLQEGCWVQDQKGIFKM